MKKRIQREIREILKERKLWIELDGYVNTHLANKTEIKELRKAIIPKIDELTGKAFGQIHY